MPEFDIPITVTFETTAFASAFIESLEQAKEDIIWEQRRAENGTVIVQILNITNLEERGEQEDNDRD